ncbi:unnamed protein product [Miscanthus lutarioriparius]|uniref:Uncharacterized protein n=1 Tax=Miscanthus lutarioriparius TaxID=422564 RepID=A0A811NP24_9POAL|nr:unnamed protein product [Miscanthus lutarioriparius]
MCMENLDLNSQVDAFPHLDVFPNQEQLQADGGRGGHGLPPLCPGGKGSLSHFHPPRPSSHSRSGARSGGRPSRSGPQGLPMAGIDGGGRRGRVPLRVGRGSTFAGTAEDVDRADENEEQDDNDFDPRFQSA